MDREDLLDRLVTSGHLNVPDRESLGSISRKQVFVAVRARLAKDGYFPPAAGVKGTVYEGPQIRRSADGRYLGIDQRASVFDPALLAEEARRCFENIDAVVNWYIDAEWGSSIDGIRLT